MTVPDRIDPIPHERAMVSRVYADSEMQSELIVTHPSHDYAELQATHGALAARQAFNDGAVIVEIGTYEGSTGDLWSIITCTLDGHSHLETTDAYQRAKQAATS